MAGKAKSLAGEEAEEESSTLSPLPFMTTLDATPRTLQPERLETRLHQPPRPNIVLIMADDFPRAALHAYGLPRRFDVAPNLMSLYHSVERRYTMSEGYTTSSLCTPSRLAFMTGRYFI